MAFKIYKSENYFIINDTSTGEDVLRQVRDNVRWEKKDSKYSFFLKSNLLLKNEDQFVKSSKDLKQLPFSNIYGPIDFADTVDSTGTAWASEPVLDTFLNKWTGYIHIETIGADASWTLKNTVPTTISSGTIASGGSADITAPDGTINIKKTGDGTISSQSVPSGATVDYPVADNAITVNGANDFTIHATDSLDIVLKDTTGATVTPDSVTPHAGTHHVDIVLTAESKSLYWELNFNGTDDVIYIPATTNNVGTLTSGSGSNVGTVTVSTDGVTYGTLSFPFTPTATTTYYFKRSTATVSGAYTMVGTYV